MMRLSLTIGVCVLVLASNGLSASAAEFIGAKSSKVYHSRPDECASAKKIRASNRVQFVSKEEAEESGRRLCKRCESLESKAKETKTPDAGGERDAPGPAGGGAKPRDPASPPMDPDPPAPLPEFLQVTEVLTGGTLVLDNGEKAKLLGVICPERGQPFAKEAVRFIGEQTNGRTVRINHEASPCLADGRDALGRLLVYATPDDGGRDLGGELIFQGYAWLDRDVRFDRQSEYARHEAEAWRAGRGVWARLDGGEASEEVVTGRHAWNYHRPKCPHVAHLSNPLTMTLGEAKGRRLTPCSEYRGN